MISKLLRTNVLAIQCLENLVLVGMGSTLYVFDKETYQLKNRLDYLYPSNIHGIVPGTNNNLVIFGSKSICICDIVKEKEIITFKNCNVNQFNDWIIAVEWISVKQHIQLAILFAHNYVCIYDIFNTSSQVIYCKEKCILYGGSILKTWQNDLIIFSGTVFKEILIWRISNNYTSDKSISVLHRLTGHKGVIFSVIYDPYSRYICSTSDDRTVRLWKVMHDEKSENNSNVNWQTATIVLIKTMFGHTARVWRAIIRKNIIVTIGEDSLICTWSLSGNLLDKVYAHHGAPIWSIDISKDNEAIYTGGGDGSVYVWPSTLGKNPKIISICLNSDVYNNPKYISFLNSGRIVLFNEKGTLVCYDKKEIIANELLYLNKYHTYRVMQVSPCRSFVAFASIEGYITIYKEINEANTKCLHQIVAEKIMQSQIISLQWVKIQSLIVCGVNGLLNIFSFTLDGTIEKETQYILPSNRERWLTAAIIYEGLLICGDRAGNIHVFEFNDANKNNEKPIQTISKVHGKIGVQSFSILKEKLMTTGRDGMLKFYELNKENRKSLLMLHRKKMPMDWISRTLNVDDAIFILGFKEVEFIIYDLLYERILIRIPCGGGHRSWDCRILDGIANFAYIRNKQIYMADCYVQSWKLPILQNGFHVKETCCLQLLSKLDKQDIFVSGGEDCMLRVSSIFKISERDFYNFSNLGSFYGHLSGIKCISSIKLNSNTDDKLKRKYLIFSGGGRAQLKIWEITLLHNDGISDINTSCSDIKSHMLYEQKQHGKKQETKHCYILEPETRYMDIYAYYPSQKLYHVLIFIACADGYLRVFVYDIKNNNTYLKICTKYVNRCILKIYILRHQRKVIVLTMTTDGIARFFDFTDIISKIYQDAKNENYDIKDFSDEPFTEFCLHQSGINSFDLKSLDKDRYILITGGDDNLLNLVCFQIVMSKKDLLLSSMILSKWNTVSAHCAQITGLRFKNENEICSVGIDQRVITYSYSWYNGVLSAKILKQIFTSVTDVQGMELWSFDVDSSSSSSNNIVCIYGRGFEVLSI